MSDYVEIFCSSFVVESGCFNFGVYLHLIVVLSLGNLIASFGGVIQDRCVW